MEFYLHTIIYNSQDQAIEITVHTQVLQEEYCIGYCLRTGNSDLITETVVEILAIYDENGEEISLTNDQEEVLREDIVTIYLQKEELAAERLECTKEDQSLTLEY